MRATHLAVLLGLLGCGEPRPIAAEADARVRPRAKEGEAPPRPRAGPARLYSVASRTWIWPTPRVPKGKPGDGASRRFLGYVRVGGSVPLVSSELVQGTNCRGGFVAVAPRGYVCLDATVTLDASTPFLANDAATRPAEGAFPYRYALSNGAPMYTRLPTAREARRKEGPLGPAGRFLPLPLFQRGHEALATLDPIAAVDPIPDHVARRVTARERRPLEVLARTIPHGSMLSFTRAFAADGRTWLLSTDLTLVPADRVREFRRSRFVGTRLGSGVELPIAWARTRARPRYRRLDDGRFLRSEQDWQPRSFEALTGREEARDGRRYLETRALDGAWLDAADATVVTRREERPRGVRPGEKWLVVSITQGTLVAYDDATPVYATLISPGQGGVPRRGGDHVRDSTTPLGSYRITFKDRASTMSPNTDGTPDDEARRFWIADVPFTQYFSAPFAIHASYWHESFGEPMSAGCINASPSDAEWLFDWTGPSVPEGWQGATGAAAPENGGATWVIVTR
ncbi:MAG: L,D-transpeptidase [Deltaproteobacteria bacterium]|nr:L,D-transpeptidase [Deltaproteobacteria bacterium]